VGVQSLRCSTTGARIDRWVNGRPAHPEQARLIEALKLERSSQYLCSEAFITFISKPPDEVPDLILAPYNSLDGHDVGSGAVNVFLYAEDSKVDIAISTVVHFFEQGKLPKGMRIGRAIYEDEKRKNWHFQPVYPPGLAEFDIMYSRVTS